MTDFIGVYKNAASDDYCERMIKRFHELESCGSGYKGQDTNAGVENRKDFSFDFHIHDQDLTSETNAILDVALNKYIDEHPALGMQSFFSSHVKVQRTMPKGGFHKWHCEHSSMGGSASRNLTWAIYLSDVPEGEGETEFLEYGKKVQPEKGLITFFPAAWTHTHRGNPVYTCDKYIATGWYYLS